MSGHSKWATIKHKKGAADKKRGKLFAKLIKQVEVAARQGGGELDSNPTLRTMYQKARDNSVPLDTIERAIKRGIGELDGVNYEDVTYEGYAPNGVALYIQTLTDNRNRTSSEVRSALSKNGGSLAEPGSVAWQFERKGVIVLDREVNEDELMSVAIDYGAEDLVDEGDTWRLTCDPAELNQLRDALEEASVSFVSSDLTFLPSQVVSLQESSAAKQVLNLIDILDELDDVDAVHANFDIPDAVLQELAG
ncbi:MAG: YebC/PmpR family DNA-binding transcriptional regulator [Acidimicrobiales bacterium]|jgi:YebC/PmpR family DNA-binding regulatory protein|nr:YebC/PmpR family DNA-binding transcriptional regulator [Acidimicrobiales bacterium]MDP6298040.1 YebC/PmpR family DNA-binding transcriptional regulator [Acidimicrobiales bacterium]HJM28907.1 YebC/PmpR family DNA-binding transcriptional regulator [Acidimicrobiales bacterium]HJM97834.1 YebC/PmpR family DNA-binding transcriptional regulator [Acidimicrobiales bacterium]